MVDYNAWLCSHMVRNFAYFFFFFIFVFILFISADELEFTVIRPGLCISLMSPNPFPFRFACVMLFGFRYTPKKKFIPFSFLIRTAMRIDGSGDDDRRLCNESKWNGPYTLEITLVFITALRIWWMPFLTLPAAECRGRGPLCVWHRHWHITQQGLATATIKEKRMK